MPDKKTYSDPISEVEKTVTTGDMDVTGVKGGLLPPEQEKKFINRIFEVSGFRGHAEQQTIKPNQKYINSMTVNGRVTVPHSEGQDDSQLKKPAFAQKKVETQTFRVDWAITKEAISRNIQEKKLGSLVANAMAKATNNDREEIMIIGDKTSADPFLASLDGLLKKGLNEGIVIDAEGKTLGDLISGTYIHIILAKMYRAMPQKFKTKQYRPLLRYFMHPDAIDDFVNSLQKRNTTLGDTALIKNESGYFTYKGIPLVPIDAMPTNLNANGQMSGSENKTAVILTHANNIVEYIEGAYVDNSKDGVQLYTEFIRKKNQWEWTAYLAYGFDFYFTDQVVIARNVKISQFF